MVPDTLGARPTRWAGSGRTLALGALTALVAACSVAQPITGVEHPDLSGPWSYRATELHLPGGTSGTCTIQGMRLELGPWRSTGFYGRTQGGELTCTGDLAVLNGPIPGYPVRRGGMVNEHVAFDIGTSDWRHEGTLRADTMSGTLRLQNGGLSLTGRFRAVRGVGP